jgi:hypothetical protein
MSNPNDYSYVTRMDIAFAPLEKFDVRALADACPHKWFNQTLCRVNESVVRLGVVEGEYHWHKHDDLDEFEDRTVELGPQQGYVIPKGVMHRPRSPERSVILMVEGEGIVPTGD